MQPVDRVVRQRRDEFTVQGPPVPHDHGLPRPFDIAIAAVLQEPFGQQPGLSRVRRPYEHYRVVAGSETWSGINLKSGGDDRQRMMHEPMRYRWTTRCDGRMVYGDGRHGERPGGERGLHADRKTD